MLTRFQPMFHFCTLRFSNVFRGYRNETLVENGLTKNMVSWFGAMLSPFLAQACKSSSLELDRCLQTIVIQCKYTCILKLLILLPY